MLRRLFGTRITSASNIYASENPLALKCDTVCFMKTDPSQFSRNTVCVSPSYICYCVKAGLIRAIHSATGEKTLIRGHDGHVMDLKFSLANSSMLCTTDSGNGDVDHLYVWKLSMEKTLGFEKVFSMKLPATHVLGHPLNEKVWSASLGSELCIFSIQGPTFAQYTSFPMHLNFRANISGKCLCLHGDAVCSNPCSGGSKYGHVLV